MVVLHVKRGDESLFLYETNLTHYVENVVTSLLEIHNGRLKVERLCSELQLLRDHGASKPSEIHHLLEDQIEEPKLSAYCEDKCVPCGGFEWNKDPTGRRNGRRPKEEQRNILDNITAEAKGIISKEQVKSGVCLTLQHIQDAVSILKGGVELIYTNDLPLNDPVRQEFENKEDLSGTEEQKRVKMLLLIEIQDKF